MSERYSTIDVTTHHVLRVFPSEPSTPWSIEFDLIGTTLTAADVFTIGQLAVSSAGAQLTTMTVAMFAADDVTPIDLTTLAFEQHALISPNFDALLDWDPATGALAPIPEGISKNSGWGFYGPADVTVGRIVVTAAATGGPDAINFSFGIPLSEPPETVPEPASAALLLIGAAGLAVRRRRRSAKR